jgi:hypothetical protein
VRLRQEDHEFKASLGYIVRTYLKSKAKQPKTLTNIAFVILRFVNFLLFSAISFFFILKEIPLLWPLN